METHPWLCPQLPTPHQAGEARGGAGCGAGGEQRGLPSEKGGEGGMDIPLWVLGVGDQQGRRGGGGKGLSPISCVGVTRAGPSREIPPLQSKAGRQKELRGSAGLISEGC